MQNIMTYSFVSLAKEISLCIFALPHCFEEFISPTKMITCPKSNSLQLLHILDKLKPYYLKYMFLWHQSVW